ncbi:unnamed protein product [Rotaria sp. Silwood2]|nr:unnamed protein product [Rotaria sp. Silwood2]
MIGNETQTSKSDFVTSIFTIVLTVFNNLLYLNCDPFAESDLRRQSFYDKTPTFFSSTLLELHINVASLNECLYLLDGRLNQLHTFYVDIDFFTPPSKMIKDKKLLPNMRCFLLMSGLFKCVREVSLFDDRPFEHEFFVRIAQAFPLLKKLSMINLTPQNQKAKNNNEYLSIIEYPHLIELDFLDVSDDYLEQFLVNTKTFLIDNICIYAYYESLKRVTNNFRRAATRFNSAKVNSLRIYGQFQLSKRLIKYFPNAKI